MWRFAIKRIPAENQHWNDNEVNLWFTFHIEIRFQVLGLFEANFPPQVYLENDKSSLGAEVSHYCNIFSLRV